jgi:ribosomal protein L37E
MKAKHMYCVRCGTQTFPKSMKANLKYCPTCRIIVTLELRKKHNARRSEYRKRWNQFHRYLKKQIALSEFYIKL